MKCMSPIMNLPSPSPVYSTSSTLRQYSGENGASSPSFAVCSVSSVSSKATTKLLSSSSKSKNSKEELKLQMQSRHGGGQGVEEDPKDPITSIHKKPLLIGHFDSNDQKNATIVGYREATITNNVNVASEGTTLDPSKVIGVSISISPEKSGGIVVPIDGSIKNFARFCCYFFKNKKRCARKIY